MNMTLQEHRFEGRVAWQTALTQALLTLPQAGAKAVYCCDPDFALWPLNRPDVIDALTQWAQPGRRLTLLARDYNGFRSQHPRFVQWRTLFGHLTEVRQAATQDENLVPLCLSAPGHALVWCQPSQLLAGAVSLQTPDAVQAVQDFDAILQRSIPALPATVLGL